MADVINLNRTRKAKARASAKSAAAANRARFGRTKAETLQDAAEAKKASEALDQTKRET